MHLSNLLKKDIFYIEVIFLCYLKESAGTVYKWPFSSAILNLIKESTATFIWIWVSSYLPNIPKMGSGQLKVVFHKCLETLKNVLETWQCLVWDEVIGSSCWPSHGRVALDNYIRTVMRFGICICVLCLRFWDHLWACELHEMIVKEQWWHALDNFYLHSF